MTMEFLLASAIGTLTAAGAPGSGFTCTNWP